MLVVTHDLGLAWNIADRLAVMYLGRIVESGPTAEVLAAPRHPYTDALLSVLPGREPVILRGEAPDPSRTPRGCRFHPRCPALAGARAAEAGIAAGCVSEPLPILPAGADHAAACLLPVAAATVNVPGPRVPADGATAATPAPDATATEV